MTDTYPTLDKQGSKNPLQWKLKGIGVLLLLAIIVIIWLLTCNKPKVPSPPNVIKSEKVTDTIRIIDTRYKVVADSLWAELKKQGNDNDANYKAYIKVLNDNAVLQNENFLLEQTNIPDTCKALQAAWIARNNNLIQSAKRAEDACKTTITGLNKTIRTTKQLADESNKAYTNLKRIADTCAVALNKMEKYAKKIKPRSEIFIGANVLGQQSKPLTAYGISLGLRNKKGTQFEIGAYQFNSQVLYQVGIKKTLFRL